MNVHKATKFLLGSTVFSLLLSVTAGSAFAAHSFTSAPGPRGNTLTATSSVHAIRSGVAGTGTVSTSNGRSVTGSGAMTETQYGTYVGGATATTASGRSGSIEGSGNAASGSVTVSGKNGSKTGSY